MKKIQFRKPDIKGFFERLKNLNIEDIKKYRQERKERRERILMQRRNGRFARKMQPIYRWMNRFSLILHYLQEEGPKRYSEILHFLEKAPKKTLTSQLRELEEDGVITRKVYPTTPVQVEYSVTEHGQTLYPILEMMCEWGSGNEGGRYEITNRQCC